MLKSNVLLTINLIVIYFTLTACESWQLRSHSETGAVSQTTQTMTTNPSPQTERTSPTSSGPESPPLDQVILLPPPADTSIGSRTQMTKKIGVIVGPGHLRSFIAVGILQELQKAKIPIQSVIGLEWGAIPAALFSLHGQANEVEWQMMKMKEKDFPKKGLLSQKIEGTSIANLGGFLTDAFSNTPLEQMKIPFTCLSLDLNKRQYFWMRRGSANKVLQNCIAHPPYFYSDSDLVAGVDLKLSSDYLKQMGANFIIFINILPSSGEPFEKNELSYSTETLWANHQQNLSRNAVGLVDFIIDTTSIQNKSLDFENRRDMVRKGQELGHAVAIKLSQKLGL
jgi:NTE family protein